MYVLFTVDKGRVQFLLIFFPFWRRKFATPYPHFLSSYFPTNPNIAPELGELGERKDCGSCKLDVFSILLAMRLLMNMKKTMELMPSENSPFRIRLNPVCLSIVGSFLSFSHLHVQFGSFYYININNLHAFVYISHKIHS